MSSTARRSLIVVALAAMVCVGLTAPSLASAKTKNVTITAKMGLTAAGGGRIAGTTSGTFGSGKGTGTAVPPKMSLKIKVKGGTITATVKDGHLAGGKIVGTFTLKGTGKYSKLKGSGKLSGNPGTFVFTYKGKASW